MRRKEIRACISIASTIIFLCTFNTANLVSAGPANSASSDTIVNEQKEDSENHVQISTQKDNISQSNSDQYISSYISLESAKQVINNENNSKLTNNMIEQNNYVSSASANIQANQNNTPPVKEGWNLVWNDEFNGNKLDETKWSYDIGNGYDGWGNYESQYYKKENVSVGDGKLKITAKKENQSGFQYTSGKITTKSDEKTLFSTKYGYIEARIKLPEGTGLWPAFWMLPVDNAYGMWPLSGEIDIMEAKGRENDNYIGTIHYGEKAPNNKHSYGTYSGDNYRISDYHTYAVQWDTDSIVWLLDGEEFYRATNWYTKSNGIEQQYPAPFDKDFYLILNLAVGGNFDNFQMPQESDLPGTMEVDYVRVYHKENDSSKDDQDDSMWQTTDNQYMVNLSDNLVKNGEFTKGYDCWTPYNTYFNIQTELNNTFACVNVKKSDNPWDVLFMQKNVKLEQGKDYELSFKAKATDSKGFIVKIEDAAYNPILNDKMNVNTEWKNFTYRFTATKTSYFDLKYLLGDSIGNCKLCLDDVKIISKTGTEKPQGSNLITNGDFCDKYDSWYPYNTYYELEQSEGNTYSKIYTEPSSIAWNKMFLQNGIAIFKDTPYKLTFRAKCSSNNQKFSVVMADSNYTPILNEGFIASTSWKNYSFNFSSNMTGSFDLKYFLGLVTKKCQLYIDDIVLSNESVSEDTSNLIQNGDFANDYDSWYPCNTYYEVKDTNGNKYSKITTDSCANAWDKMFIQKNLSFDKNSTYCLSFKARASVSNQKFGIKIEDSTYNELLNQEFMTSMVWSKYEYLFTTDNSGNFDIKYLLGSASQSCSFFLDDIVIRKVSSKQEENKVPVNLITNGDFNNSSYSWSPFNTYFDLEESDENVYSRIYTGPSQNSWDLMFLQSGIQLQANKNYEISFKAKCSENNQKFGFRIEDASYRHVFDVEFSAGKDWNTFSYQFTSNMTGSVDVKYLLGLVNKECALYLDDIVIYQKN